MRLCKPLVCLGAIVALAAPVASDEDATPFDHLEWRAIGPVNSPSATI